VPLLEVVEQAGMARLPAEPHAGLRARDEERDLRELVRESLDALRAVVAAPR